MTSGSVAGAEMITFFAPAARCLAASSRLVKKPVDSITTSQPRSPQRQVGRIALGEDLELVAVDARSSRRRASTSPGKRPRIESYLSRCASVSASVRSLTATMSRSAPASCAARKRLRPIRPKPLMPTFVAIVASWSMVELPAGAAAVTLEDVRGSARRVGVQRKKRSASSSPATPQSSDDRRGGPTRSRRRWSAGRSRSGSTRRSGGSGRSCEKSRTPSGISLCGMKTPERK